MVIVCVFVFVFVLFCLKKERLNFTAPQLVLVCLFMVTCLSVELSSIICLFSFSSDTKYPCMSCMVIHNYRIPLVTTAELIVISRIFRHFGYSCCTHCHIASRKYLSPIFTMDTLYCVIKYSGLVKTKAHWVGTLLKQKPICNKRKVKP